MISALEDTQTAKGDQEKMKKIRDEEREEFEKKKKEAEEEKVKEIARKAEEEAKELYKQAQAREEKAQEVHDSIIQKREIQQNTLRSIADSITGVFEGVTGAVGLAFIKGLEEAAEKVEKIGDKEGYQKAVERARREKMMYFEQMKKERDQRREAIQQCIECTQKIMAADLKDDLKQYQEDERLKETQSGSE